MSSGRILSARLPATSRRTPVQRRSRERVERILHVAERIVVRDGIDELSMRALAARARLPVGSLYTYFADREAIITALIERHTGAMDERVTRDVSTLQTFSVRTIIQSIIGSYRLAYQEHPSFVVLWFQGRVSPAIVAHVRERNKALADAFHAFGTTAGLLNPGADATVLEFGAEMIDSFLELAYRDDINGNERIVTEGSEMVIGYLERHATPKGIQGIDASDLSAPLETSGR
jgi:AcrR family transcriptional regulator